MEETIYEKEQGFLLHQPFFNDEVIDYNEYMQWKPYQALFYEFTTFSSNGPDTMTYIPNGCIDILFIRDAAGNHMEILGSSTEVKYIHRLPNARYFGVRLRPGLYIAYEGMSLKNITNQDFFIEHIDEDLAVFFRDLMDARSLKECSALFRSAFDSCLQLAEVNPLTEHVLNVINQSHGTIRIHELADDLHYSERHLSRIFQDSMGISPKTFARIVRFQTVLNSILRQPVLTLCDYMAELGYSDQAHFQREFKQYTGTTPKRFLSYAQKQKFPYYDCNGMEQRAC